MNTKQKRISDKVQQHESQRVSIKTKVLAEECSRHCKMQWTRERKRATQSRNEAGK